MAHSEIVVFFCQIGAMLAVAIACGQIARRLGQPAVLGELMGGVLIGPTVFQAVAPGAYAWLFPQSTGIVTAREAVLQIGMLFFLFVAGLEVNLGLLRRRGLCLLLTAVLGAAVPFAVGFGAARVVPGFWNVPEGVNREIFAVFLGTALCISALPVIARILFDLGLVRHEIGVITLAAATINDLIGWSLLALILGTMEDGRPARPVGVTILLVLLFAVVVFGLGRIVARLLLRRSGNEPAWSTMFIGISGVLVLLAAAAAESLGLHAVFGAFLVGVSLGHGMTPEEEQRAHHVLHEFAISFFAPLYFVSIGLRTDFVRHFDLGLVLVVVTIACVGKVGGAGLGAWLGGMPARVAVAVGFGMNARGAMEMILATVALESGLIDERIFVALVVMALATSMISGPALRRLLRPGTKREPTERTTAETPCTNG